MTCFFVYNCLYSPEFNLYSKPPPISMEGAVRTVHSYKKTPVITVPQTPDYLEQLLPSAPSSLLPPSPNNIRGPPSTTLGSPFHERGWLDGSSSQPRLCQSPQTNRQKLALKFEKMEVLLRDSGFDSVSEFLEILFHNPSRIAGEPDLRGSFHAKAVSWFLQGRNEIKMSDIISLIYKHKRSAPSPASPLYSERHAQFSPLISPGEIFHARPSLFWWATNLVSDHVHREIYELTGKDDDIHLRASTNGRHPDHVNLVTWEALGKFSIASLIEKYKARAPVSWYLTESMAASRKRGIVILKKRCPHLIVSIYLIFSLLNANLFSQVQVGAISSFILARNHYANGDLAMVLGIWHFAAKSHVCQRTPQSTSHYSRHL